MADPGKRKNGKKGTNPDVNDPSVSSFNLVGTGHLW